MKARTGITIKPQRNIVLSAAERSALFTVLLATDSKQEFGKVYQLLTNGKSGGLHIVNEERSVRSALKSDINIPQHD